MKTKIIDFFSVDGQQNEIVHKWSKRNLKRVSRMTHRLNIILEDPVLDRVRYSEIISIRREHTHLLGFISFNNPLTTLPTC